jgi:nucleoside-diphosphate-sugar epimerase
MMSRVFITGGTGFLGSRLTAALQLRSYSLLVLDRSQSTHKKDQSNNSNELEIVAADLLEPEKYRDALKNTDVVLHLAALTGKGSEQEHFRVNAVGTETLVDECRRAGVRRMLFVSSIATKWENKSLYYYAQAKARAEAAVRASGLRFSIIRPTIILGEGSPILAALRKLACLPIIPVFGNGRVMVQPISVDDLVDFIITVLDQNQFHNETLELGGPTVLTIEQLLQEIRRADKRNRGRVLRIPLSLVFQSLKLAESIGLGKVLPLSAGQLYSFRYNGTIESNPLHESRRSTLHDVRQMLSTSGATAVVETAIECECRILTRYLLDCEPRDYVTQKYVAAHQVSTAFAGGTRFDFFLIRAASTHPMITKLVDAYARLFYPTALVRKKLVLLLAILETCAPSCHLIDAVERSSRPTLFARLCLSGFASIASVIAASILFVPARIMFAVFERKSPAAPVETMPGKGARTGRAMVRSVAGND